MELKDFFLTPIYLLFIYTAAYAIRNKYYLNSPLRKYFITGLTIKIIGAISVGLIYQFYYDGGDTFFFYQVSSIIWEAFLNDPIMAFKLLIRDAGNYNPSPESIYVHKFYSWYFLERSAFFVSKIAAIIGFFCFNSYTVISCFFAFFSFLGIWLFLLVVADFYPGMEKQLAQAILFVPSVCFWGSGIFKDTISFGSVGALTYFTYIIFFKKKHTIINYICLAILFYLVVIVKIYILFAFLPALVLWIFRTFQKKIKSKIITMLFTPLFIVLSIGISYQGINILSSGSGKYSLDKALYTIKQTQEWHSKISPEGSSYTLGEYESTIVGVISKIPLAINVTLFGPYLWNANGPLMLFTALESLVIMILTVKIIYKLGLFKVLRILNKQPFLVFCLLFSLILAFIVGFTTYNYGALVRYRIPIIPFYLIVLFSIKYLNNCSNEKLNFS